MSTTTMSERRAVGSGLLTARNATVSDIHEMLLAQRARTVDVVVPAQRLAMREGLLSVEDDGFAAGKEGPFRPTAVFDEGIADKLAIPLAYLRRLREQRPDLYDANVNGWLHGGPLGAGDSRSFLVRLLRGGEPGSGGVARALLSDRFRIVDNLDVLTAALDGVRRANTDVVIDGCDLTERRMYVRFVAPQVVVRAPRMLDGYRSPFRDNSVVRVPLAGDDVLGEGGDDPILFAGFVLTNSEVGDGAFSLIPRLFVRKCRNGWCITTDAVREVHLGARLDAGVIEWSTETQRKMLDLIASKSADAARTFLTVDYLRSTVAKLEATAATPIGDIEHVREVTRTLGYDDATANAVFDHFVRGGQMTAGGLMQAVTSVAQTVGADAAFALETTATRAMSMLAAA